MAGLLIVGAGGHGKVVADAAQATGLWNKIAFIDDRFPDLHKVLLWPVLGSLTEASSFRQEYGNLVVAVGDNLLRVELLVNYQLQGFTIPTIIHPRAVVSPRATVEVGSVIFAQAAVNIGAVIGRGAIINTGATVDHDCCLGDGVHLSPGVHLSGEVTIGNYTWLGTGAAVIQQITIGSKAIIGAGAAVIRPVADEVTAVGNPAQPIQKRAGK